MSCDVKNMLKVSYRDPRFSRGYIGDNVPDDGKCYIKGTKTLNCWKIVEDTLQKINDQQIRILFDAETYLFDWTFECLADNEITEERLVYYWRGINASKSFCPLPPEIEDKDTYVERLVQWSETALFLHIFPEHLIILNGKQEDFNPNVKRLLLVRGELSSEIHLNEVPCLKENLRSRGVFLLIDPSISKIFYWYGSAVPIKYQQRIQTQLKNVNEFVKSWTHFSRVEMKEGHEYNFFLEAFDSKTAGHFRIQSIANFTPRLFYFNSITGDFLATEVEYPLKSDKHVAPFPFLQSHLYTIDHQPALFLLDNNSEIWLWEGWKTPEANLDLLKTELELAKETAVNYAKEKGKQSATTIPVKHVVAGLEPVEFINIFPYWNKRDDITEKQLKDGHSANIDIIKM